MTSSHRPSAVPRPTPHYDSPLHGGNPGDAGGRGGNVLRRHQWPGDGAVQRGTARHSFVNSRPSVRARPSAPPPPDKEREGCRNPVPASQASRGRPFVLVDEPPEL